MSEAAARDGGTDVDPAGGPPSGVLLDGAEARPRSVVGRQPGWLVVAGIAAVLFLVAAWFAARRGIVTDTWPAFLPDTDSTSITRYSGPWLTAAAAAVLGAGLSVMALVRGLTARAGR